MVKKHEVIWNLLVFCYNTGSILYSEKGRKEEFAVKILLVMPARAQIEKIRISYRAILPPSPLLEVAGLTDSKYHDVRIWDELAQRPVSDETLAWADLVGISGLTTSRFGAYRVARAARKLKKPVVAGGMDVTGHYFEGNGDQLLEHYDAIVVGRLTRRLWAEVLADFENHRPKPVYQAESLEIEPWEFAVPRHDLITANHYYFPAAVRSSAGCPYRCNFCTVGLVCDRVQVKPYDILKRELGLFPQTRMPLIDCSDSFGVDYEHTRKVALPLLYSSGRRWLTEITIRNLMGLSKNRQALLGPMADAGCMGVYLGIESVITRVGGKSPSLDVTEEAIKEAHKAGLIVIGSLILDVTGEETRESNNETVDWILRQCLDLIQLSLVAALPGSELRRVALERELLITKNPELFDGAWPTIEHPLLSPQERIEMLRDSYLRIYSPLGIARRVFRRPFSFLNLGANLAVNHMSRNWWGKVDYDYWEETRNLES